ncbi:MAG: hypothetical protein WBP44_04600, partial [Gammaproteobacteria bacterium]
MTRVVIQAVVFLLFCNLSVAVNGFELATHGRMTFEAYQKSLLASNIALLADLGLEDTPKPFGESYMDHDGSVVKERDAPNKEFTQKYIVEHLKLKSQSFTIAGWLMRGAIREDDHNELHNGVCNINPANKG